MNIGIFTDTYIPFVNGVTTSILTLRKSLEEKGHTVYIVTVSVDRKFKIEEDGKVIRLPSIPVHIYDYRLSGIYSRKALKIIKNWNLDVIHSQTEFDVGIFARLISIRLQIPIVHTYHTMYEDYMHYITKGHFDKLSKRFAKRFSLFFCNKKRVKLIVPTQKIYDLFKEKYNLKKDIYIIPTGIDVEKFNRDKYKDFDAENLKNKLGIKRDDFTVLFVGRIGKEKNIDMLASSMVKLVKKSKNIKLLIVGDGPEADNIKKISKDNKLEKNIIFTGKISWEEIQYYYFIADCFATPSRSETQGLTVIEAMAAGLPVVAINDESFKETVFDNKNGLIFDDEKMYVESILKLKKEKELLKELSSGAKATAEEYSLSAFGNKLLKIYKLAIRDVKKRQDL